jgi:hypothetical protein
MPHPQAVNLPQTEATSTSELNFETTAHHDDEPVYRKKRRNQRSRTGPVIGGVLLLIAGLALFAFAKEALFGKKGVLSGKPSVTVRDFENHALAMSTDKQAVLRGSTS